MKSFKDFQITNDLKGFDGDKIKMKKIINKEVVVYDYVIKDSKYKDKCLYLQIEMDGTRHVVFTGSKILIHNIEKVPKEGFPFKTTIVQENERFEFT